jgi:DNA-binding response OmpR family regulator
MFRIVTSPLAAISEQLSSPKFRRLGVEYYRFDTGAALLAAAVERAAQLVVVEAKLPDMTGFDLCQSVKAHPLLQHVRVILVLSRSELRTEVLQRVAAAGCDDILALPASAEELYQQVARLFRLPQRLGRRICVELFAEIEPVGDAESTGQTLTGRVVNVSARGARVVLDTPSEQRLRQLDGVRLTLSRPLEGREAIVVGRVAWRGEPQVGEGAVFGVEFDALDDTARRALNELSLWEVIALPDRTEVVFQGDFTEAAEFGDLADRLQNVVEFDLGGVRYMNSAGVRKWVQFLERLTNVTAYTLVRCSTAFVVRASIVPRLVGTGRIESFWAPYICERCEVEDRRLLQVSTPTSVQDLAEMQFRCSSCEGSLMLDDVPERVFAFLSMREHGVQHYSGESSFG